MQSWQQFYEMIGGAAATLLGLLFVSVSLNAETILGPTHKNSRRLAEQAFQNYLAVLMVSLIVVFPNSGPISLGYTLMWVSGLWGMWALARVVPAIAEAKTGTNRFAPLRRYIATVLGFAILVYAAYGMTTGAGDRAEFVAIGVMMLLVSATLVSWDLLIKLAEDKYRDGKSS